MDAPQIFHRNAVIDGLNIACREAGEPGSPKLVLLPGFPASSHQYRNLIPALADRFHVIAPDYPGFGNSDMPDPASFACTFDKLADVTEAFLKDRGFDRYGLFVQDYGGPVCFRLITRNPDALDWLVVQNSNAYEIGFTKAWDGFRRALWKNRSAENEAALAAFLEHGAIKTIYLYGAKNPELISPDNWKSDFGFMERPNARRVQLDLFYDYRKNVELYPKWQAFLMARQPKTIVFWGRNDLFFTPEGGEAYLNDLPNAEMHRLDAGYFAAEDSLNEIAEGMHRCYSEKVVGKVAPPFTLESAARKVQLAEDAWNSREPERVALSYSPDSEWRNRTDFIRGRKEIVAFLKRKWAKELDYRLKKTLWGFRENRIAVSFEYEWRDAGGQWYRSYGNELWEFDDEGLMRRRLASINDAEIAESDRHIF
jgi:nuclear transport factor 2 (NTF2) superfamily protein/pimeloyl-ACP methyl ester carboxylesterase